MPDTTLQLHYQPILHRRTNRPLYYEALLRKGQVSASKLLERAELENTRNRLERQALALAWDDVRSGHTAGLPIAVNISPKALSEDLGSWRLLLKLARESSIFLEVTEDSEPSDPPLYRQRLEKLDALGVRLVLDNVGTGYAHFTCLVDLPFTYVKLDKHYLSWWRPSQGNSDHRRQILTELVCLFQKQGCHFIQEGLDSSTQNIDAIFPEFLVWFQGFALKSPERKL